MIYFVAMHALYGMIVGAAYDDVEPEPRPVGQPEWSSKVGRIPRHPSQTRGPRSARTSLGERAAPDTPGCPGTGAAPRDATPPRRGRYERGRLKGRAVT